MTLRAFYHPAQGLHAPRQFMRAGVLAPTTDVPARTAALLGALDRLGIAPEVPPDLGRAPAEAIHPVAYLDFLETAFARWQELPRHGPEVLPNTFPAAGDPALGLDGAMRPPCPSPHLIGQTGWYLGDLAVALGPQTWTSALHSTHSAAAAADVLAAGASRAYALCRPSGHHCRPDRASGFCYLNNAAIAAERLRRAGAGRVAILDIDAHHGDGTQATFYDRGDVLTVSIHVDPDAYYPFYTGRRAERGRGPGEGANLNLPLAPGAGDADYRAAIVEGVAAVRRFGAEVLILGLGFDNHAEDPLSLTQVTTPGFAAAGEAVAAAGLPVLVVQEGGYAVDVIGGCLEAFLGGLGA